MVTAIEAITYETDFLRLAIMLGMLTTVNLFFMILHLLGYEITRGEAATNPK